MSTSRPGDPGMGDPIHDPRARWARPVGDDRDAEWGWSSGRRFPWFGAFLVLLGLALVIRQLRPEIGFGTLLLLALALALTGAWLLGGSRWASLPALILLALSSARILAEMGVVTGEGWTSLFLGAALLVAWAVARLQDGGRDWALWIGLLLFAVGLAQVSDRLPNLPDLGLVVPLAIIAIGVVLMLGRSLPGMRGRSGLRSRSGGPPAPG